MQSNRRLLSQLDDLDQGIVIGNAISKRQENTAVYESAGDQDFTVDKPGSSLAANEDLVKMKTLESCFNKKIDKEMDNIVGTVEVRIQNAILTSIDIILTPRSKLAVRLLNASSGRDATNIMANSERGKDIGITAPFENVSEKNITVHVFNTDDGIRNSIPDEVSELLVSGTHCDRQPQTHRSLAVF